jgi:diguanylate cyclase (GGDEF)-like protein
MDRVKYEQERLYEAFALLNEALQIDTFAERLLDATVGIKKLDFAAVTLFDEGKDTHTIACVRGKEELRGASFHNKEGGLVAMALKNGHRLPYVPLSEQPDRARLSLFGRLEHPELESVKVFPLSERGKPLGALILGSKEKNAELSREEERMIDVVCSHAAITLANARMYAKMEEMVTGLVNRRRFNELLAEALARATRFERKVSVMMVDADHFKSINDTYGHPVGDLVLKRIATLLSEEARRTDVVARYGGEEFVVILDETDIDGAKGVAERVRERIERELIQGDFGRIRVTASLGVAAWPDHAQSAEELLDRADQALYEAKKKGRNRVVGYRSPQSSHSNRPAPSKEHRP